jgi:hypothetical protein
MSIEVERAAELRRILEAGCIPVKRKEGALTIFLRTDRANVCQTDDNGRRARDKRSRERCLPISSAADGP